MIRERETVRLRSLLEVLGKPGRIFMIGAFASSCAINILYLAPIAFMAVVYDKVLPAQGLATLIGLGVGLTAAYLVLACLDIVRNRLLVKWALAIDRGLALSIVSESLRTDITTQNRSFRLHDLDVVKSGLTGQAAIGVLDMPWSVVFVVAAAAIHPLIGLIVLLGGGLLVWLTWIGQKASGPYQTRSEEDLAATNSHLERLSARAGPLAAMGMRQRLAASISVKRDGASHHWFAAASSAGANAAVIKVLRLGLQSLLIAAGAALAIQDQMSAGAIFAASILAARALAPIEQTAGAWRTLAQMRSALGRLSTLKADAISAPASVLPDPRGLLEVKDIIVRRQQPDAPPILAGVSLRLEPGQAIAIVGPSGSGKSTLAEILAGARSPDFGVVRLDGADRSQWGEASWARHVGYLPQSIDLIEGTILQNICRFETFDPRPPEDTNQQVIAAATAANVHDTIVRSLGGYTRQLQPLGMGVSGGQAQKIALARALFRDPPLLVLDEPSAFLDQESLGRLRRVLAIRKNMGRGLILISHDPVLISGCDLAVVLHAGMVRNLCGPRDYLKALRAGEPASSPGVDPQTTKTRPALDDQSSSKEPTP